MGWSGSLNKASAVGASTTYTADTGSEGAYSASSFTAPKKGVYRFALKGSGGTNHTASGGNGGSTTGYLLLENGQTVYIGAGGTCSAAYVSSTYGGSLAAVSKGNLYFVAGAGGAGGGGRTDADTVRIEGGGVGGGSSGGNGTGGSGGGTQSAGGAAGTDYRDGDYPTAGSYGTGGSGGADSSSWIWCEGGRGGDGLYGGGGGSANAVTNSSTGESGSYAFGGGGGSGYIHQASLTVRSKTYGNATNQGGGAGAGSQGSVQVTYYARSELPIVFNGTVLERLVFNGTEIEDAVYDGARLFMERMRTWLSRRKTRLLPRAA